MPDYFNEVEIMETFRAAAAEVQCCTSFARRTALSPNNSYLRNHYLCISISLPSFYLLKLPLKSGKRCCSKEEKKGDLVMLGRGGERNPLFFRCTQGKCSPMFSTGFFLCADKITQAKNNRRKR